MVLVLSTLNTLLAQLISLPELHTALLLSPEGQLISVASDPSRPKDKARVVAGVSSEVWQETKARGYGTIESELGRILVLPIGQGKGTSLDDQTPLLLLALNSTDAVGWDELQAKGKSFVDHLSVTVDKLRDRARAGAKSPTSLGVPGRKAR